MWLAVWSATVSHQDHAKAINSAIRYGMRVYSCEDVKSINNEIKVLRNGLKTKIGAFLVQPIPLFHNVPCIGFAIEHKSMGKMIFCTDTCRIPYRFHGVNHIIVECNYDNDFMIDNLCNNVYSQSASENHFSFCDSLEFLKNNYSKELQTIILIHASKQNINKQTSVQKIKETLCFDNVVFAKKGLNVDLQISEF